MKDIEKLNYRPFTRFCMSIGAVPSSYLAGLDIEEQLLWLCSYLEKEVIPAVNNNGEAVKELQNLYIELKNYVDNYFDNLDVQEEINTKLDAMAEDGTLDQIINQEIFGQINEDISVLQNDVNNIELDLKTKTSDTLEYMWTHHTTLTGFQALCVDSTSYYYYEGNTYNLYKRNLSDNELTNTYNIPSFGHGNDMTIINGIIYNANFADKNINTYNLSNSSIGILNCLHDVTSYGIISGITKYDNTHLLVVMAPSGADGTTKLSDCGLFKVDIANNIYEPLTLDSNNMDLSSTSVIQSCEYVNGALYMLTSQPSMITQFVEDDTDFKCSNIFDIHDYDVNGLPYGEMEGIALLPDSFNNGKGTMLIYSQMKDYTNNKSLKFYCFNPMIRLPLVRIPVHQVSSGNSTELTNLYLNANASGYYEIGTSAYPFKKLVDALNAYNFSKYLKFKDIQITGAGTYDIKNMRNIRANIFSNIAGVVISGVLSVASCKLHIEGDDTNQITINVSSGFINNSEVDFINCSLNYSGTGSLQILNSKVLVWKTHCTLAGLLYFQSCMINLLFRSISTTREDGKFFTFDNNNMVAICSPSTIVPADSVNKGYSVVIRYNNVSFS